MSSYSSNSTRFRGDQRITSSNGMGIVNCYCAIEAGVWVAWKPGTKNPDRGREVIVELLDELSLKRDEVKLLKNKVEGVETMQNCDHECLRKLEKMEEQMQKISEKLKLAV
ncbi:hypothetical protein AG4045_027432 [Apium graveolens]|uniref:Uncharacterized protein n=1 Tax=Apium graveolens TaxID=4045 RepID=A0A6L5B784_APIGR|nr:hypothetical protein AG4045_027432 [Apium graveolens]